LVNGKKKEEVLARAETELEKRVLEQVWQSFEHIREWGSLVRIEESIEDIIEEELEEVRATGQTQFTEDGLAKQSSVVSYSGEEESWEQVKERLLGQVSEFAEEALEHNDPIEEMFVGEVEKSVRLLDLFVGDYDVVLSNPPYLGRRKMGQRLKTFVKDNYRGNRDLYTAFIERNEEFVKDDGYVSMITMETFMYLYSYRGLRDKLLDETDFVDVAHLENRDEGYMNVCFTTRCSERDTQVLSKFNRLVHTDDKRRELREVTTAYRNGDEHDNIYIIDQDLFEEIRRQPFVYWFGQAILQLFIDYPSLAEFADVKQGLGTGDDDRFVRDWWELNQEQREKNYKWHVQSGSDDVYYDSTTKTVLWGSDGERIKSHEDSNPRNKGYYGKPGITFRNFSKFFTARLHPSDHIFSKASHFIYTGNPDLDHELVGYLCSSLIRFIMDGINSSVNFQVGDAKTLPIKLDREHGKAIKELVKTAVSIQESKCSVNETKREFSGQSLLSTALSSTFFIEMREADVAVIHGIVDDLTFSEYDISADVRDRLYEELPKNLASHPHIVNAGSLDTEKYEFREEIPSKELSEDRYAQLLDKIDDHKDNNLREISESLEISPYTVAMVRHEHDVYTRDEQQESAGSLLSYYLGCAMGRWDLENLNPDNNGIIVFDSDFEDDVMSYMRRCIELTFGKDELYEEETKIEEMLNKSINDWLRNTFFRYHHCKEYRRRGQRIPIYWQLESDDGAFSCFLYYHAMDGDTLPKLRGQYVDVKLDTIHIPTFMMLPQIADSQGYLRNSNSSGKGLGKPT